MNTDPKKILYIIIMAYGGALHASDATPAPQATALASSGQVELQQTQGKTSEELRKAVADRVAFLIQQNKLQEAQEIVADVVHEKHVGAQSQLAGAGAQK